MDETVNHGLNLPEKGAAEWHIPLNENFSKIDGRLAIKDSLANRPTAGTPGRWFLAVDQSPPSLHYDDGDSWVTIWDGDADTVDGYDATDLRNDDVGIVVTTLADLADELAEGKEVRLKRGSYDVEETIAVPAGATLTLEAGTMLTQPDGSALDVMVSLGRDATLTGFGTLDGNTSNQSTATAGIGIVQADSAVVSGVTVQNFAKAGVYTDRSSNVLIRNVTGDNCQYAVQNFNTSHNTRIDGCVAKNCTGSGIQGWGGGESRTTVCEGVTISNCVAVNNASGGIFLNGHDEATVTGCTAIGNGDMGINYEYCHDSTITGCTARNNDVAGVACFLVCKRVTVSGCTATRSNSLSPSNGHGFWIHGGSTNCLVVGCIGDSNDAAGIAIDDDSSGRIVGGITRNNGQATGLSANRRSGVHFSTGGAGSAIIGVSSIANATRGIHLSNETSAFVIGCYVDGNTDDGIELTGNVTDTMLTHNAITNNGGDGISVVNSTDIRIDRTYFAGNEGDTFSDTGTRTRINGVGAEQANANAPTSALWEPGDVVEFTDTGDGSGTGVYTQLADGSWTQIGL